MLRRLRPRAHIRVVIDTVPQTIFLEAIVGDERIRHPHQMRATSRRDLRGIAMDPAGASAGARASVHMDLRHTRAHTVGIEVDRAPCRLATLERTRSGLVRNYGMQWLRTTLMERWPKPYRLSGTVRGECPERSKCET